MTCASWQLGRPYCALPTCDRSHSCTGPFLSVTHVSQVCKGLFQTCCCWLLTLPHAPHHIVCVKGGGARDIVSSYPLPFLSAADFHTSTCPPPHDKAIIVLLPQRVLVQCDDVVGWNFCQHSRIIQILCHHCHQLGLAHLHIIWYENPLNMWQLVHAMAGDYMFMWSSW